MTNDMLTHLKTELEEIKKAGLYKEERVITSAQSAKINSGGKEVINLCANNYLGLSNHPDLISQAKDSLENYGFGMSSFVSFAAPKTFTKN